MKLFYNVKKAIAAAGVILLTASASYAADLKYIFYFIGDGMGVAEVTNAQWFNKDVLKSETPLLMTTFPVVSMINHPLGKLRRDRLCSGRHSVVYRS